MKWVWMLQQLYKYDCDVHQLHLISDPWWAYWSNTDFLKEENKHEYIQVLCYILSVLMMQTLVSFPCIIMIAAWRWTDQGEARDQRGGRGQDRRPRAAMERAWEHHQDQGKDPVWSQQPTALHRRMWWHGAEDRGLGDRAVPCRCCWWSGLSQQLAQETTGRNTVLFYSCRYSI